MNQFKPSMWKFVSAFAVMTIVASLLWGPVSFAQWDKKGISDDDNGKIARTDPEHDGIEVLDADKLGILDGVPESTGNFPDLVPMANDLGEESEPNGTSATANHLNSPQGRVRGLIRPAGDIDFYSFTITSAARLYAATQSSSSVGSSTDTFIDIIGTDGTTVIESDNDDGSFSTTSSVVAGTQLPSAGTYFIRVRANSGTATIRPYALYFAVRSGLVNSEIEPNDSTATANSLIGMSEIGGFVSTADIDLFSFPLNAGDTVFLALNIDPERDNVQWNGRIGFGLFGSGTPNQILTANDNSTGSATNPLAEAMFFTVKDAGTYFMLVDEPAGGAGNTYTAAYMVMPGKTGGDCTVYASTDVPKTIPTGPGSVSSEIIVPPGSRRIDSIEVYLDATHTFMADLDVNLVSPNANDNNLFTDVGGVTTGGPQTGMNWWIDDNAAIPPAFALTEDFRIQPELNNRLEYFNGEDPTGTWRLDIRDDATGDGGTLNNWSLRICEQEADPPGRVAIFSTDFEANDGGFTHSGTQDEWEYGAPATAATSTSPPLASFLNCASGVNCWKTDLDSSYNASSSQELVSPAIAIPSSAADVRLEWMMRYQIESANFDHAWIEVRPVGNPAGNRIVGEWDGGTMTAAVGNPTFNVGQSAGWGFYSAEISEFAGQSINVVFHLDSDTTIQLGGLAIDDFRITRANPAVPSTVTMRAVSSALPSRGLPNVQVTLTEQNGTKHYAITNTFGYVIFFDILSQQNITLSATSKRHSFTDLNLFLSGSTGGVWQGTPNP